MLGLLFVAVFRFLAWRSCGWRATRLRLNAISAAFAAWYWHLVDVVWLAVFVVMIPQRFAVS